MNIKRNSKTEVLAVKFSNFILKHFTSEYYQKLIEGFILYGMNSAAYDREHKRPAPPNWWEDKRNLSG